MCGIFVCDTDGMTAEQARQVETLFATRVAHRGPDACRVRWYGTYLVAFYRLAVTNLSPEGVQPFEYWVGPSEHDRDRDMEPPTDVQSLALVCNGQIYNYRELAASREGWAAEMQAEGEPRSDVDVVGHLLRDALQMDRPLGSALGRLDGDFALVALLQHGGKEAGGGGGEGGGGEGVEKGERARWTCLAARDPAGVHLGARTAACWASPARPRP
jgi:asparagine synthetase B (glutamine-hydrolysing)